jgi:hypothetical protein
MRMTIGRHAVRRPPQDLLIEDVGFTSDFHPITDVQRTSRHFASVPIATNAPQQTLSLFDHLVGALLELQRHLEAERLRNFKVDDELKLARLYDRQVGWLLALENPAGIALTARKSAWVGSDDCGSSRLRERNRASFV